MNTRNHTLRPMLAAALMLTASAAFGQASAPTDMPTVSYGFDEGTGTTAADGSGHGLGAALQGNAGWAKGLVGANALHLTGRRGSFADIPQTVVDTARSYTVTACVKVNQLGGYQTFASVDGNQISGFFLQLRDDGEFSLTVPSGDGTAGETAIAASDIAPTEGRWYHLAGVYNSEARTVSLYVNGVLQRTVPFHSPWTAGGHTEIGRGKFAGNLVDFANADIDDVRFYQAALPTPAIAAIAQADLPPSLLPLSTSDVMIPAALTIQADQPGAKVNPLFYGLMTEEINYSYDGGLYAEMIRNRAFRDTPSQPAHWSPVSENGAAATLALEDGQPVSAALPTSLALQITAASPTQRAGVANDGYWGIPVTPKTSYQASFYARADAGFAGPLSVSIESADGKSVYARADVPRLTANWHPYTVTLKTGKGTPSLANRFVLSATHPGTVHLSLVSLFPPTYHNRPNGRRVDLMEKMAALKPAFLRLPGGNYLEGNTIATRFDWKKTIGPLTERPGHFGPWGYRSSDGLGLLEFLEWCEDLHMEPLLAVYAGYSLNGYRPGRDPEGVGPGPALEPFVQDALDEIEYVTGDVHTKWGAVRAQNGHPAPFPLHYVEIGNEDFFDRSGSYDGRFAQFYDALKAKYPQLQLIATTPVKSRTPDIVDDHFYKSPRAFEQDVHHYDNYDRKGPKIFVGEWASQSGRPTPDFNSALGDAAWMTGMERNADVVILESYAPMFVNVNPGGSQWGTNLIGYDALHSYGSPSYYVQALFASHHGDRVLPTALMGGTKLSASVTQESSSGTVYIKVVNAASVPQPVQFTLHGVGGVESSGTLYTLSASSPKDTNSITEPTKIVPVRQQVTGLGTDFAHTFPAYSVTVVEMRARGK